MKKHYAGQCGLRLPPAQRYTAQQLKALIGPLRDCGFSVLMLPDMAADCTKELRHMKRTGALLKRETDRISSLSEEDAIALLRKGFLRSAARYKKRLLRFAKRCPWHMLRAEADACWQLQSGGCFDAAATAGAQAEKEMLFWLFLRMLRSEQHKKLLRYARRRGMTIADEVSVPLRLFTDDGEPILHTVLHEAAERCELLLMQCSDAAYTAASPRFFDALCGTSAKRKLKQPKLAADRADNGTALLRTVSQFLGAADIAQNSVVLADSGCVGQLSGAQQRLLAQRLQLCKGEDIAAVYTDTLMRSDARLVILGLPELNLLLGMQAGMPAWDESISKRILKKLRYYGRVI